MNLLLIANVLSTTSDQQWHMGDAVFQRLYLILWNVLEATTKSHQVLLLSSGVQVLLLCHLTILASPTQRPNEEVQDLSG